MTIQTIKSLSRITLGALIGLSLLLSSSLALAAESTTGPDATRGAKIWADTCNRCHNMRSPTDLNDEQWIASVFHMRVRAGLTGQQARDVLQFLQNSNGLSSLSVNAEPVVMQVSAPASTNAADGQSVYEASCVACHGANGRGALPGVPDFTAADGPWTKSDDQLLTNIINGFQSPGSPMPMPARGGNTQLTDAELAATLDYIKAQFKP